MAVEPVATSAAESAKFAAGEKPKRGRGRPAGSGKKKRHDIPEGVPVDGDYRLLTLKNKDPKFDYAWFSDADRATAPYRAYVPELWAEGCCQPAMFFGEMKAGTEVKFRELTLHKVPKAKRAAMDAHERKNHNDIIQGLLRRATQSGGSAKVITHEVTV